ncbi:MAG: DUF167 domain-containing protein [Bryobacteraceae bacterium]
MTLDEIRQRLVSGGVVRLKVKVTPKAGRSEIQGFLADGTLKARVRAAPERGKANAELCELVARELGLKPSQVEVLAGASSPLKTILVRS